MTYVFLIENIVMRGTDARQAFNRVIEFRQARCA